MREIETSGWGEFTLSEVFDIQRGTGYPTTTVASGETPLVSAKATNNSIALRADVSAKFDAETITLVIDGSVGYATVQPEAFDIASNAVALLVEGVSIEAKLFACAVIRKAAAEFNYGNKLTGKRLTGLKLVLPQTLTGEPDWDAMAELMGGVMDSARQRVTELSEQSVSKNPMDTSTWGEFVIGEICQVKERGSKRSVPTGSLISKQELQFGAIPRVSVSGQNNGVVGVFQGNHPKMALYGNFVSVSFLGSVFYQPHEVSLEMKVHCVKPADHELTEAEGLFLASVVRQSLVMRGALSYGDQVSSSALAEIKVKLPQTLAGEPDWDAMSTLMSDMMTKAQRRLVTLQEGDV